MRFLAGWPVKVTSSKILGHRVMKRSRATRQQVSFPAGLSTRKASQVGEGRAGSYADPNIFLSDGLPEPIGAVRTVHGNAPADPHV